MPQQPPMIRAPRAAIRAPLSAKHSGVHVIKVAALVIAWPTSVRESGKRRFRPGKPLDETKCFVRTVDAIDSKDFGVVLQKFCKSIAQGHAIGELSLLVWSQRADRWAVVKGVLHAKGKEELIEILKRLQEDQIDAAVEQSAHLCAKALLSVDAPVGCVRSGNAQGTNAAGDKCSLRRLPGKLRGVPVDFIDAVCKPVAGEAHGICAEGVGFDEAGAGCEVISVNLRGSIPGWTGRVPQSNGARARRVR